MSDREFTGDVALVTGATSGIGRAIAKALGSGGANVVASGIGAEAGAAVVDHIRDAGSEARFLESDLSGTDGWSTLLAEARKPFGPFSILVHAASPPRPESQTVLKVTEAEWDAMINTNLRSGFFLAREVAREMKEKTIPGRILFVTSLHAYAPRNLPHYSASKAGQTMVVKELARALGPDGIRVNAVAPGAIPGGGFAADVSTLEKRIAMGRTGTPEDVAAGALALLSQKSGAYVTGTTLAVDGGLALHDWIDAPTDP
ncbi:MAG: oxidoreductase [Rhodospirillaceae bacterium]|nr:oxidoreductase [Rhodospirillaceae bacterium]|tara:strand:+ start:173 stop:949 length:777 start_codon:yes stop_codon:yes gene_type:complete